MKLKKLMKSALLICLAGTFVFSTNMKAEASEWRQENGEWYFSGDDGTPYVDKWLYEGGCWYYFNSEGKLAKGLTTLTDSSGSKTYYFNPTTTGSYKEGRMMTGWQYINGNYMYFNSNGIYEENNTSSIGSIKGIDVSQYQGNMDWTKVKEQGISFAFIRVGHGDHKLDPYYSKNMVAANAAGIQTGVYFYSTATSTADARSDAQWVIDQLQGYNISYPVALDLEDSSQAALGKQTITNIAKTFCNEIKAAGYTPMVYCNENWAKNYVDFSQLPGVYKWIARYNGTYNTAISRDIWQAGSTTLLEGITVNSVDIDFGYTDFTTITTPRSVHIDTYSKNTGTWMQDSVGWWYDKGNGSYAQSEWLYDGDADKYYYFNSSGYMYTGWLKSNGKWYYMADTGMATSCWINSNGKWAFVNSEGVMLTGWNIVDGKWYYMSSSGYILTGWAKSTTGKYFYLSTNGMLTNEWLNDNGKWYYMNKDGVMVTGWQEIEGSYYYFYDTGEMAYNTTIDGYYLGSSGAWE